jgi:hypothetical protein
MPRIEGNSIFRRSDDVVSRTVGREAILVPVRQNVGNLDYVYTLSPVAARIWELLDGSRTVDALVEAICGEFEVADAEARADVEELLSDLSGVSLVARIP